MGDPPASEWDGVPVNPDLAEDLGYVHEPLTAIHLSEYDDQFVFLPGEEASLSDAEFAVVPSSHVCELADWR